MSEPLMHRLAELPTAEPDSRRAERTRRRCRALLARQAPVLPASHAETPFVWQPLVALLGVVYLIVAIAQGLSVLSSQF